MIERTSAKVFLVLFILSAAAWLSANALKNYEAGRLLVFGTVEFQPSLDPVSERAAYTAIAQHTVVTFSAYPLVLITAFAFLKTTRRSVKEDGWLLMSAILLFMFIPVELYCFWLDWKIVGLNYWGDWPLEEFRKAVLARVTALAGMPLIAQLCYFTIPIFVIFKPLTRKHQ
jgi:hypothetical protein